MVEIGNLKVLFEVDREGVERQSHTPLISSTVLAVFHRINRSIVVERYFM
jgi:hypothetical protein